MKVKPQFVASGVGANWLPAARALAMAALLALAATASEQTNGTWTGADGATWDTSAVNWSGSLCLARPPARCALRAIGDVFPSHFPVLRLA